MAVELVFVTGGVRSGKSRFALEEAARLGENGTVTFVATAGDPGADTDMARRVAEHREARPGGWATIEAGTDLGAALRQASASDVVLIDDLTQWASRILLASGDPEAPGFRAVAEQAADGALADLFWALDEIPATVIVVTNEVGSGVSPATRLGNVYADVLGAMNRRVAERSDRAYLLVSGMAVRLK